MSVSITTPRDVGVTLVSLPRADGKSALSAFHVPRPRGVRLVLRRDGAVVGSVDVLHDEIGEVLRALVEGHVLCVGQLDRGGR